jgi:hypothetical protein
MPILHRPAHSVLKMPASIILSIGKNQVLRNLAGLECIPETRDKFW